MSAIQALEHKYLGDTLDHSGNQCFQLDFDNRRGSLSLWISGTISHNLWFCSSVVARKVNKTTHILYGNRVEEMQLCISLRTTLLLYTASSLFLCPWLTERPCLTQPTHLPCMAQAWGGERSFLQTKYQWSQTSLSVLGTAWRTSMTCYLRERLLLLSSDKTYLTACIC